MRLRISSLPAPPYVELLISWLNGDPIEKLIHNYARLNLNLVEQAGLDEPPKCIVIEKDFTLMSGPSASVVNLYCDEKSRNDAYKAYRNNGKLAALTHFGYSVNTTYDDFCKRNLIPQDKNYKYYDNLMEEVRNDQRCFLINSIKGNYDKTDHFFTKIFRWFDGSQGHWTRKGMFMVYEFVFFLEPFPTPTPFLGYMYKKIANMVLAHKEPKLELFKICEECGNIFYAKQKNTMYCSSACKMRHYREKNKKA